MTDGMMEALIAEEAPVELPPRHPANSVLKVARSLRERRQAKMKDIDTTNRNVGKRISDVSGRGISAHYTIGQMLHNGKGDRNRVYEATAVPDTGQQYIIKERSRNRNKAAEKTWRCVMETILNSTTEQAHCVPIEEVLVDENNFYVITKLMEGGELRDFLISETEVPEPQVKRIIREILLALKHLHDLGMIHRDVKPENLLFENYGEKLKLIDFDLCQPWSPLSPRSLTVVGTPGYIAPECLLGNFSPLSDIWSVGVIFYALMVGDLPYSVDLTIASDFECHSPKSQRSYKNICEQELCWEEDPWPMFPEARDLCRRLLDVKIDNRIQSVDEALQHPFMT